MRDGLNDLIRAMIGVAIRGMALGLELVLRYRIATYRWRQQVLRRRFNIAENTPIRQYDAETRARIESRHSELQLSGKRDLSFALTSGSTREPKKILYTRKRLLLTQFAFAESFTRILAQLGLRRKSIFIFSALQGDRSLTALLLEEPRLPSRLSLLQAPYRAQSHPDVKAVAREYGEAALRLFLLALSNPGVIYATNPSTLSAFFEELRLNWEKSQKLVRDWVENPGTLPPVFAILRRRLGSQGTTARLRRIAESPIALSAEELFPGLEAFSSWDGGYVRPFLDRLERRLPRSRYRHIPMYSMSTETIETLPYVHGGEIAFLPVAPGVLYEFLPEEAPATAQGQDDPRALLNPEELEPGRCYSLVVSDAFGLLRYQTEDLFRCERMIAGLPDLRFVRRRNLSYSFTGEKLTAEQARLAIDAVAPLLSPHPGHAFLCLIPSRGEPTEARPHYKALWIFRDESGPFPPAKTRDELASHLDQALQGINSEYESKRGTGRLGAIRPVALRVSEFTHKISGNDAPGAWQSQFKFLPLYNRLWEDLS